ncbi:MAG: hypothetical protein H6701_05090 [Myxococcales bacterium]|nr:hypothetical protein [Myxococcales bacterium]
MRRYHDAAPDGPPARETAATRKAERRLYLYLQRFCTKAETTSAFGPIAGGRLDPDAPRAIDYTLGPAFLLDRRTYPAGWLVDAAIDAALARHGDHLPLRAAPDLIELDGHLHRYQTLDPFRRALRDLGPTAPLAPALAHAPGHTLAALRAARPDWLPAAEALIAAGALTARPIVPRQARDGLAHLAALLRDIDAAPLVAVLDDLSARIAAFRDLTPQDRPAALAAIAAAVEAGLGVPAFRHEGRHYADRQPFFEDATRDVRDLVVGAPIAAALTGLGDVLDLWHAARLPAHDFRVDRFQTWLDATFPGRDRVGLPELIARDRAARRDPTDIDHPWLAIARLYLPDAFPRALAAALRDAPDAHALPLPPAGPIPDAPCLASADILLLPPDTPDAPWRVVLGEAHRMVCAFRFFLDGLPAEAETEAAIDAILRTARGDELLLKPYDALDAKLSYRYLSPELLDFDPDGRGPTERPAVSWRDLELARTPAGWRLYARHPDHPEPRPARFLFASPRELGGAFSLLGAAANAKGLPPEGTDRTPPVHHGDLTVLRACWAIDPAPLCAALDHPQPHLAAAALARLWADRGLPRYTFVRSAEEPKPIFFDALNPMAHAALATLARQTDSRLVFSEMTPGPDALWFRDDRGRYVAELRLNLVRSATSLP